LAVLVCVGWSASIAGAAALPFLHAEGDRLVDSSGTPVLLKGCNLGNWLLLEPWMFGGCIEAKDQDDIFSTLAERFGEERRDQLVDLYRRSFITPRDFELIKTFGFNVVRLPFHYSVVQEETPPYRIKVDAFVHLDRAVDMAEAAGIYVILDLHGAPGGQSKDMPTGKSNQNHLWTDATDQQRMIDVWRAVAQHFHDRSAVAAYDLLNEPYGSFHQDLKPDLVKLMSAIYPAVREVDQKHVLFFPGVISKDISFYGNPHEHGWQNVGFTEHFYPGLFSSSPVVESHARTLNDVFPKRKTYLEQIGAPYYVGEFNVVLRSTGGVRMMREYFDRFAQNGWTATMWSYKLLQASGHGDDADVWYAVTNMDRLSKLDLHSSSFEDFQKFFGSLATVPLSVNLPLRDALTVATVEPVPLTKFGAKETDGAAVKLSEDWKSWGTWNDKSADGAAGLWQDVAVTTGERYRFSVKAVLDGKQGKNRVELRLENAVGDVQVVLNSSLGSPTQTPTVLSVSGTSIGPTLRVLVRVVPGDGKIRIQDASLTELKTGDVR
jgi:endoglucanase